MPKLMQGLEGGPLTKLLWLRHALRCYARAGWESRLLGARDIL